MSDDRPRSRIPSRSSRHSAAGPPEAAAPFERLTDDGGNTDPAWSPDGSRFAFVSEREGNFEVYLMDLETREVTNLTDNPAFDSWPAWSPLR